MAELLRTISSAELTEWMAFYELEPWGAVADDLRAGNIAAAIYNVNRNPKKSSKPVEAAEFRLSAGGVRQTMTDEAIYASFKAWALLNQK